MHDMSSISFDLCDDICVISTDDPRDVSNSVSTRKQNDSTSTSKWRPNDSNSSSSDHYTAE
mgnify:CR=1 FL=1